MSVRALHVAPARFRDAERADAIADAMMFPSGVQLAAGSALMLPLDRDGFAKYNSDEADGAAMATALWNKELHTCADVTSPLAGQLLVHQLAHVWVGCFTPMA